MSVRPSPRRERGFTLVELLVVMLILGLLAAIAVPMLLRQRRLAVDASLRADLSSVAAQEESYAVDAHAYLSAGPAAAALTIGPAAVVLSRDTSALVTLNNAGTAYCIKTWAASGRASRAWFYVSSRGGAQPETTTSCPAPSAF